MNPSQKPIKVVYIVGGLPYGGVETWLLDLAKNVPDYQIEPIVINISGKGKLKNKFKENKISMYSVGNSYKSINTYRIDTLLKLFFLIRRINPDLIHTSHFSADYFGRLANIFIKKPIIAHIHNIKYEKKHHRRLANKLLSFFTTSYLSVSKDVYKKSIAKHHNTANRPVHILSNMIDEKKFNKKDNTHKKIENKNKIIIAGIGRLVQQKNFSLLIEAFAKSRFHMQNLELFLIGDGPEMENLKTKANSLDIADNTYFLGYREDIPKIIPNIDLLVMPSAYEGFGIAALECFYCGIPAIVSHNTAI